MKAILLAGLLQVQMGGTCFDRETLIETLRDRFEESLTGGGLQSSGQLLEIWSSDITGSWTVFVTYANGTSCVMASGNNWHSAPPGVEGDPT